MKSERYKGYTITFGRFNPLFIGGKSRAFGSQYLGLGRTKAEAYKDTIQTIDNILKARKKKK